MKFITFRKPSGESVAGLFDLKTKTAIELQAAARAIDVSMSSPVLVQLLQESDRLLDASQKVLTAYAAGRLPTSVLQPIEKSTLLSPLPRPTSLRDGYAFRQHVEASRKNRGLPMIPEFDLFPVFYFGNALSVSGPGTVEAHERHFDRLDFELEVAVVLGRKGKNVSAEKADQLVFGYTIMNDWSSRGLWEEEFKMSMGPAKGKDFGTSLGPWLVTKDEFADKTIRTPKGNQVDMPMRAFVNGEKVSDGNLKDMSWTFAQILERASYGAFLEPGEVIGSGTCGTGCFFEFNGFDKSKRWLRDGDTVVLECEGLGRLENRVKLAPPAEVLG